MKIGKATVAASAICTSDDETIGVRGHDLCRDLIGQLSFTDYFWLLVTGERPGPMASRVLDATLVAIAEHGLVHTFGNHQISNGVFDVQHPADGSIDL